MSGDDEDRRALEEAMRDVKPLRPGPRRADAGRRPRRGTGPSRDEEPVHFEREDDARGAAGIAPGVDRAHLRRLRAGDARPERRIDLHGHDARAARDAVRRALRAMHEGGERCLLVVHGRGAHSADDPVLRAALPEWLAEAPHARRVMAFCPAQPRDGGAGASYVLLRRRRG